MNIALLEILRTAPNLDFSPEELGRRLAIPPTQVFYDLRELRRFGFGIERAPHRKFRYTGPARQLCPDQIEWELGTRIIGRKISVWRRVRSTNDLAAQASSSPTNDGLVVLAEEQAAGRGRRNRRWIAPRESSILMSVLLFPAEPARDPTLLTCLAAVAVADVLIEQLNLPARIKWPNDVRVDGFKVCGVLVEELAPPPRLPIPSPHRPTSSESGLGRQHATVVGIGLNVNIAPEEFPPQLAHTAGSLMQFCGRLLDRSDLARAVIRQLDRYYLSTLQGSEETILCRWRDLADLLGRRVRVERAQGSLSGTLIDLWPKRGLTLEIEPGKVQQLASGEVLSVSELPQSAR